MAQLIIDLISISVFIAAIFLMVKLKFTIEQIIPVFLITGILIANVARYYFKPEYLNTQPDKKELILKQQYDSLQIKYKQSEKQATNLKNQLDSVIAFTVSQQYKIDSLILVKNRKKIQDEKKFASIGSIPDKQLNDLLAGKLK